MSSCHSLCRVFLQCCIISGELMPAHAFTHLSTSWSHRAWACPLEKSSLPPVRAAVPPDTGSSSEHLLGDSNTLRHWFTTADANADSEHTALLNTRNWWKIAGIIAKYQNKQLWNSWRRLESLVLHKTKQKFYKMTSTEAIKRRGKRQQRGNETDLSIWWSGRASWELWAQNTDEPL